MTLRITKANISGFTGDSEMIPVEPEQSQFYIPSAVEAVDNFSIDLIVEGVYPDIANPEVFTYQYATDVRSSFNWASIGVTFTKLNAYTVRLTGPATGIFVDQFYKFKMTDYSEQVLPANTELPFLRFLSRLIYLQIHWFQVQELLSSLICFSGTFGDIRWLLPISQLPTQEGLNNASSSKTGR
jgi:hypothetical protein